MVEKIISMVYVTGGIVLLTIVIITISSCGNSVKEIEKDVVPTFLLSENINTCEDMIEWMNEDVFNGADSTIFDDYIYNLEQMIEDNRKVLYTVN